ncbi:MAG: AGE family epimerase/isomerase, partial [Alphaproteobacteria bacterium]
IAPHRKSAMTHLHLLIAMTHYQPIAPAGTIGERLAELILILTTTATRLREGAPTEVHAANWRPARPADGHRVSYGHIAEIAWWAPAAAQAAGLAPAMVASHSISLLDKLVDDALDPDDGGVFHEGPIAGKADRRTKVWWVQVEALRAFAEWHRWSDDLRFASAFLDILRWIENRQVVGPAGDLHHRIEPDGRSAGARAGAWKCPYHQVVGLLGAIRMMYADSQPFVA